MPTLNGLTVSTMGLVMPRLGAWVAELVVETDEALAGAATLDLDGTTFVGAIAAGAVYAGRWTGRVVGGAGGLSRTLDPTAHQRITLAAIFAETLRAAGETAAADLGDLSAEQRHWHRPRQTAAAEVAEIARAAGFAWRVLSDGTVWVGPEAWPELALGDDLEVMEHDTAAGRYTLAGSAALALLPGRTVNLDGASVRVAQVEHRVDARGALRTLVVADRDGAPTGIVGALETIVARQTRRIDYFGLYPARVVAQHDDDTVDLVVDAERIPNPQRVTIRHGLPGVTSVRVAAGARVRLGYDGGDPRRPYAALWDAGQAEEIALNGGTYKAAREGHAVQVTIPSGAQLVGTVGSVPTTLTITTPLTLTGEITEGATVLRLP